MLDSITSVQMETMKISFPKVDLKRLKGIAKAMGWTVESLDYFNSPQFYADIDAAEKEIAEGKGKVINSVEELDSLLS